jgi:phosphoribosylaminoimidazole (AIR) synthetase
MVVVVAAADAGRAAASLRAEGETVFRIGAIESRPAGAAHAAVV